MTDILEKLNNILNDRKNKSADESYVALYTKKGLFTLVANRRRI
jgi:phosphoribosyl-ATP pyrophosphohydrolase